MTTPTASGLGFFNSQNLYRTTEGIASICPANTIRFGALSNYPVCVTFSERSFKQLGVEFHKECEPIVEIFA